MFRSGVFRQQLSNNSKGEHSEDYLEPYKGSSFRRCCSISCLLELLVVLSSSIAFSHAVLFWLSLCLFRCLCLALYHLELILCLLGLFSCTAVKATSSALGFFDFFSRSSHFASRSSCYSFTHALFLHPFLVEISDHQFPSQERGLSFCVFLC